MSNTVLSIFDDYKTEFSHHFNEVEIQSIDVFKAKSHLRVILSSYNPIVFEAQSDFALFLSQKYSDFSIEQLKHRLFLKAMKNSTPKKYAGDMLEAAEVIQQLQAKIKRLETGQG